MEGKKNIALFMGILENDYSNAVMRGALKGARECDTNLIIFPMDIINADYSFRNLNVYRYQYNTLASYMSANSIDGIIIEYGTVSSFLDEKGKKDLLSIIAGKPTVLVAEGAEGYSSVCMDNEVGLKEVIEHLILDHHYKRIAFLSGPKESYDANIRKNVFIETTSKHNLLLGEDWIFYGNFSEYIETQVEEILEKHPDVEAIVCANDDMALGVAKCLRRKGIKPGKDICITGFDNLMMGLVTEPSLTTVDANPEELSAKAVHVLCDNLGKSLKAKNYVIDTHMLKRESCGCHWGKGEEECKKLFGISSDWREILQKKLDEDKIRHSLERELGNVTRELVFDIDTAEKRNEAILETMRRFNYESCAIFLYDEFIEHNKDDKWVYPEYVSLVGYYSSLKEENIHVLDKGMLKVPTSELFNWGKVRDGNRHEILVLPLFFGNIQMGFMATESDINAYLYAYDIAGQISNIFYTVDSLERLEKMQKALENANQSKSHFLANMSHEIRTPINAIIGFNEMILAESRNNSIIEYAQDVKSAADALLLIVNDTLDFSKIEAGKMELVLGEYKLYDLIKGIIGMMSSRAEKKGLLLKLQYNLDLPSELEGDYGRIQQILINLLSNAIKYTEKGEVLLIVDGKADGDKVRLSFKVKDTGIGIKEGDIDRLFNLFERIEEKRNRNIEGTGLGINIICGLLKLMDSELKVESKYGVGSEFSFEIDQKIVNANSSSAVTSQAKSESERSEMFSFEAPGVRILVVDDNALNRKVIKGLLKKTGIDIDLAESGFECIEKVKSNQYDIIMLDHMMPRMDGIETLEKIQEEKLLNIESTPVIALTANAIAGAREFYMEKGFSDYLAKPVLPKDLFECISRHI